MKSPISTASSRFLVNIAIIIRSRIHDIPSLKLTWPLKIDPWKGRFLLETTIFRGYVSFREGIYPHLAPFFSWILWGLGAHGVSNDLPSLFVLRNHLHNVTFRQCYSGAPAPDKTFFDRNTFMSMMPMDEQLFIPHLLWKGNPPTNFRPKKSSGKMADYFKIYRTQKGKYKMGPKVVAVVSRGPYSFTYFGVSYI